ncbi:ribosome maturation protein [Aspergillus varians]
MTRGNARQSKVFYKGRNEDFVIMVDDAAAVEHWRQDHSIPLAQVLDGWKIFSSQRGPQGIHNEASKAMLENEFGTSDDDEVIVRMLDEGELQDNINAERQGIRNESQGTRGIQ